MIKDRNLHYQDLTTIKQFQEQRLRETLSYVSEHSKFYKRKAVEMYQLYINYCMSQCHVRMELGLEDL